MSEHSITVGMYDRHQLSTSYTMPTPPNIFSLVPTALMLHLLFCIVLQLVSTTAVGTGGEKLGGINVHILLPQLAQFAIEQNH